MGGLHLPLAVPQGGDCEGWYEERVVKDIAVLWPQQSIPAARARHLAGLPSTLLSITVCSLCHCLIFHIEAQSFCHCVAMPANRCCSSAALIQVPIPGQHPQQHAQPLPHPQQRPQLQPLSLPGQQRPNLLPCPQPPSQPQPHESGPMSQAPSQPQPHESSPVSQPSSQSHSLPLPLSPSAKQRSNSLPHPQPLSQPQPHPRPQLQQVQPQSPRVRLEPVITATPQLISVAAAMARLWSGAWGHTGRAQYLCMLSYINIGAAWSGWGGATLVRGLGPHR